MSKEDLMRRMFREENEVRARAKEILSEHMSDYTEEHISKVGHLELWIINAMMTFAEIEIKLKEDEDRRNN